MKQLDTKKDHDTHQHAERHDERAEANAINDDGVVNAMFMGPGKSHPLPGMRCHAQLGNCCACQCGMQESIQWLCTTFVLFSSKNTAPTRWSEPPQARIAQTLTTTHRHQVVVAVVRRELRMPLLGACHVSHDMPTSFRSR